MDVEQVARDLKDEQQALDDVVATIGPEQWSVETPSPRWTVADQIGHLTYFDRAASLAIEDPQGFADHLNEFVSGITGDDEALDDPTLDEFRAMTPAELLAAWRAGRTALATAAATLDNETRIAWYGPSMGSKSFLTARLMEVWAHGQDIVDALGVTRPSSDRLRHVAQLGFITRGWSYRNRGLEPPDRSVRVELRAPSGEIWRLGPEDATESVVGDAVDFCLVVTQRRHPDDTDLDATPLAREWLLIAQAFAGPPTDGPAPGTRT